MQVYLPIAELSLNVVLLLLMGFAIGFLSGLSLIHISEPTRH